MRKHYDFGSMKGKKSPYARRLRESITIRLDRSVIEHFRKLANETGLPYQTLINLYLRDCVEHGRRLSQEWVAGDAKR